MRRRSGDPTMTFSKLIWLLTLLTICGFEDCVGARRVVQRRKDIQPSESYSAAPMVDNLQAVVQATGAAEFEDITEGKALVKRLVPDNDVLEYQGVIGRAGVDFPAYPSIPNTGFNCKNVPTGYYADLETDCQVFHICDTSRKISFLCPNGTIFSQSHLICDWWFKVDCASSPALYESSAEYYSNEQKKSQRIQHTITKNPEFSPIGSESNNRAETRASSINLPSTTERFIKHRQRLQNQVINPTGNSRAAARSLSNLYGDGAYNPTQRNQLTSAFETRRKSLVQLISNNFGNTPKSTQPTYIESSTYTSAASEGDFHNLKEMQVAAETASFANHNNRQYLQEFNSKTYRPYPVYTPDVTQKPVNSKSSTTLTTLYDYREKQTVLDLTTKRPTLLPYTKSYTTVNDKREPYTRPGISLLKNFLVKEKNKTFTSSTEKTIQEHESFDSSVDNNKNTESKDYFESVTKIPHTTRSDLAYFTAPSNKYDTVDVTNRVSKEPFQTSYYERRENLVKKLNLETQTLTEPTPTEKYYGDLPNRPGLIVPPSLTPKTLHTLAIYYATALDNLSTTSAPEETEPTISTINDYEAFDDSLPALLSQNTIKKYSSLFGRGVDQKELLEEIKEDPNGTYNELDLTMQQSQNPFATSPQIRELAQVFTHALSAYLQDPVRFRKVLSEIRPTHPSFADILSTTEEPSITDPTTTINEDDEILGFSDDHKFRPSLTALRNAKLLKTDDTAINSEKTFQPSNVENITQSSTTIHSIFRCCGRISASYTTVPSTETSTVQSYTYTTETSLNPVYNTTEDHAVDSDNSYNLNRFGGFQNNAQNYTPYGIEVNTNDSKPLAHYNESNNLPSIWGIDLEPDSSLAPIINVQDDTFESKKIRKNQYLPTITPTYFTGTDSIELENEEELQRAHSQSFINQPGNNVRENKQLKFEENGNFKKPSENLEAPTLPHSDTFTFQPTTLKTEQTESSTTTSSVYSTISISDGDNKSRDEFQWPSTFNNWHSTLLDPITLNDGLSKTTQDSDSNHISSQTNTLTTVTTPVIDVSTTNEPTIIVSTNTDISTPGLYQGHRSGRLLREHTSTEATQELTTMAETVVQTAKKIISEMNSTTTDKLMNVMKKTKSKSVKRLILLLIQTCDDDHNSTAEASKKALLEALMAVSQKDMDELAKEEGITDFPTTAEDYETVTNNQRRTDSIIDRQYLKQDRRGKSLEFDPKDINSLSNPTTENINFTTDTIREVTPSTEILPTTLQTSRRVAKKILVNTSPTEKKTIGDQPKPVARITSEDLKTTSDTRALELLRSLYSIAAKWG